MAIRWQAEACDLAPDPESGAPIARLTGAAMHSTNLYFEQPYGTPDGTRIAFGRAHHTDPRHPPCELWCLDLERYRVALIDGDIVNHWFATSSWSGLVHYVRANGELIRVDLATMEKTIVMTHWSLSNQTITWSVTPDMAHMIVGKREGSQHVLLRVDLRAHTYTQIFASEDVLTHVQINHVNGREVLVQCNRPGLGATHIVLDLFDGTWRPMAIGEPHTLGSTGHASWVAGTGRIATPVAWPGSCRVDFRPGDGNFPWHDVRHMKGNLMIVGPDDKKPRVFAAPEHLFNHASMSRCGRYVVTESFRHGIPGAVEIVVGNIESGKYRTLVANSGSTGGGAASSHVHAYFTADSTRVIYNADPHGLCQIHCAKVPAGFLASLD